LTSDLRICSGATLQVDAGVEVRSVATSPRLDFVVEGNLVVNPTAGTTTTFTSQAGTPQAGDWTGLVLRGGGTHTFQNAEVRYAVEGIAARDGVTVSLDGVTLGNNEYGLRVWGSGGLTTVTATDSSFISNVYNGIDVRGMLGGTVPALEVSDSSIHGNGTYDYFVGPVDNPDETTFDARRNYWGTTNGVSIAQNNYEGGLVRVPRCQLHTCAARVVSRNVDRLRHRGHLGSHGPALPGHLRRVDLRDRQAEHRPRRRGADGRGRAEARVRRQG
jgi:hypothetical protein